jgi:DNA-directed RNA polymerase specialized sigma24 family protein
MASIAIPEWVNLAFDLVILAALGGLWILWWRTSRKQRAIEGLLAEAAQQIDRASLSLNEALQHIERIKQAESPAPRRRAARLEAEMPAPRQTAEPQSPQIAQLLRMHREGRSAEDIAEALKLPSAQVRLLLKLHGTTRK